MLQTWYRVTNYSIELEEVLVERETAKCIFVRRRDWTGKNERTVRQDKVTTWDRHFPTKDEAINYLVERADEEIEAAVEKLKREKNERELIRKKYGK